MRGHRYAGVLDPRDGARHLKLAQILPQATLPATRAPGSPGSSGSSGSRVSSGSFGDDGALARLGATLQRTGVDLATALEERVKQERATDALNAFGQVATAMDEHELALVSGRRDEAGNLTEPPATHKDYYQKWQQRWAETTGKILGGIQDADTKRTVGNLLERERITRDGRARLASHKLFLDHETASLDAQEEFFSKRAALDPDPVVRKQAEDEYKAAVAGKTGTTLSETAAGKRLKTFQQKVEIGRAGVAIRDGTFNAAEYPNLEATQINALIETDTREKKEREQQALVSHARMKEEAFGEYYAAGRDGQVTAEEFKKDNEFLKFSPPQQKAVLDAIVGRDVEDDPLILKEMRLRSRQSDLSQADVEWLAEQYAPSDGSPGRISGKTFEMWNGIFTATARANLAEERRLKTEDRMETAQRRADARAERAEERDRQREARDREREARTYLSQGLHVGSELDRLTGAGTTAFSVALDEFTRRVRGGADPDTVARDILPRAISTIPQAAQKRIGVLRAHKPVQRSENLGRREEAMAEHSLSEDGYYQMLRQLREAEQIEEALARIGVAAKAKTDTLPGASTPPIGGKATTPLPKPGLPFTLTPRGELTPRLTR